MKLALESGKTPAANARLAMVMIVLGVVALAASPAFADPIAAESAPKYAGHIYVDFATGTTTFEAAKFETNRALVAGDVYDNTTASTVIGFSDADLAGEFGDRVTTTGTGFLDQNDFTIFNSGSSVGPFLTAVFTITLYDGSLPLLPVPVPLGSYTTAPVIFTGGLLPGTFKIITMTGLSGLGINLTTTDVLIKQKISSFTGTANRVGCVLKGLASPGSSVAAMYINTTSNASGYYTVVGGQNDPGYRINVSSVPVELSRFSVE